MNHIIKSKFCYTTLTFRRLISPKIIIEKSIFTVSFTCHKRQTSLEQKVAFSSVEVKSKEAIDIILLRQIKLKYSCPLFIVQFEGTSYEMTLIIIPYFLHLRNLYIESKKAFFSLSFFLSPFHKGQELNFKGQ